MKYNYNGKVVEVCSGLTGAEWFTAIRKPSEADLRAWALDRRLPIKEADRETQ